MNNNKSDYFVNTKNEVVKIIFRFVTWGLELMG